MTLRLATGEADGRHPGYAQLAASARTAAALSPNARAILGFLQAEAAQGEQWRTDQVINAHRNRMVPFAIPWDELNAALAELIEAGALHARREFVLVPAMAAGESR